MEHFKKWLAEYEAQNFAERGCPDAVQWAAIKAQVDEVLADRAIEKDERQEERDATKAGRDEAKAARKAETDTARQGVKAKREGRGRRGGKE